MSILKRLLLFIWMLGMCSPVFAQNSQLAGTLDNSDGTGFNGYLVLSLSMAGAASASCPGGPAQVVPNIPITVKVVNGVMQSPPKVWGEDCMSPSGIPYNITERDNNGNVVNTDQWLIFGTTYDVGLAVSAQTLPSTTAQQINSLVSSLAGCMTASWYYSPAAGDCLAPPSGTFSAGGDLSGTSSSQEVKGIYGVPLAAPVSGGYAHYSGGYIVWDTPASSGMPVSGGTFTGPVTGTTFTGSVNNVINVMAPPYNAKGDCVTDDHTAIQAALTAAQVSTSSNPVVYFPTPPGGCYLTSQLNWYGVSLRGEAGTNLNGATWQGVTIQGKPGQDILHTGDANTASGVPTRLWSIENIRFLLDDSVDASGGSGSFPHRWPGKWVGDGAMTSGSAVLTSTYAEFTCADIGQAVLVKGAGASGADLSTTISSVSPCYNSIAPTTATLAANASTTVSAARVYIALGGMPVTQQIGNCAIAMDNSDGNSSDWSGTATRLPLYDNLHNVNFNTVSGAIQGQNNSCAIYFQGIYTPYGFDARNINITRFTYGVVEGVSDVNPVGASGNNVGIGQDYQLWDHGDWVSKYPWISFNGSNNELKSIQLYATVGPQLLQIKSPAETYGWRWKIEVPEFEQPGGAVSGWRIDLDLNTLLNTQLASVGANIPTYIEGYGNRCIECTGAQTLNVGGYGNNLQLTYGPVTVNDAGYGNTVSTVSNSAAYAGQTPTRPVAQNATRGTEPWGRLSADFIRSGNVNTPYMNLEDLLIQPADVRWLSGYGTLVYPDATSITGKYGYTNGVYTVMGFANPVASALTGNTYNYVIGGVGAGNANVPATRITLYASVKCPSVTSYTLTVRANGTTIATATPTCNSSGYTVGSVTADLSSYAGQNFGFAIGSGSGEVDWSYVAVRPYPANETYSGQVTGQEVGAIYQAAQFAGADCAAKINAADAALGANPGEIDVSSACGSTLATALSLQANHTLRFIGAQTLTITAQQAISAAKTTIDCAPGTVLVDGTTTSSGAVLQLTGAGDTIKGCTLQGAATPAAAEFLFLNGATSAQILNDSIVTGNTYTGSGKNGTVMVENASNVTIDNLNGAGAILMFWGGTATGITLSNSHIGYAFFQPLDNTKPGPFTFQAVHNWFNPIPDSNGVCMTAGDWTTGSVVPVSGIVKGNVCTLSGSTSGTPFFAGFSLVNDNSQYDFEGNTVTASGQYITGYGLELGGSGDTVIGNTFNMPDTHSQSYAGMVLYGSNDRVIGNVFDGWGTATNTPALSIYPTATSLAAGGSIISGNSFLWPSTGTNAIGIYLSCNVSGDSSKNNLFSGNTFIGQSGAIKSGIDTSDQIASGGCPISSTADNNTFSNVTTAYYLGGTATTDTLSIGKSYYSSVTNHTGTGGGTFPAPIFDNGFATGAGTIIPSTASLPYTGFKIITGTSPPTDTCSATSYNGSFEINATPAAYQCSNATGSYAWNTLGGGGSGSGTVNSGSGYALPSYGSSSSTAVSPSNITTDSTKNNLNIPGKVSVGSGSPTVINVTSQTVSALPATGNVTGDQRQVSDATTSSDCTVGGGSVIHWCDWTGSSWVSDVSSGGMVYPGAGIPVSTGSGWGTSFTAPSSALVGVSDSQTLINKSIAGSEINSGTVPATQMPGFTGDCTTTAGSTITNCAHTFVSLIDGSPITWTGSGSISNATVTLNSATGTRAINLTGFAAGDYGTLIVKQDATGGAFLTGGTGCTWYVGGSSGYTASTTFFSASPAANQINIVVFLYDGTNCYVNVR